MLANDLRVGCLACLQLKRPRSASGCIRRDASRLWRRISSRSATRGLAGVAGEITRYRTRPATFSRARWPVQRDPASVALDSGLLQCSSASRWIFAERDRCRNKFCRYVDNVDRFGAARDLQSAAFLVVRRPCRSGGSPRVDSTVDFEAIDKAASRCAGQTRFTRLPTDARGAQIARADEPGGRGARPRTRTDRLGCEAGGWVVERGGFSTRPG